MELLHVLVLKKLSFLYICIAGMSAISNTLVYISGSCGEGIAIKSSVICLTVGWATDR